MKDPLFRIINFRANTQASTPRSTSFFNTECCEIMLLYPVKICHLYMFNKILIVQYPSKKYRLGDQTMRILGRGKT